MNYKGETNDHKFSTPFHSILEICTLISFGYWGFISGDGLLFKFSLGIGAPLLIAFI